MNKRITDQQGVSNQPGYHSLLRSRNVRSIRFNSSGRWNLLYDTYRLGYYPATGFRTQTAGTFDGVTTGGYYWSSSQSEETTMSSANLYLLQGVVDIMQSCLRGYGFSVRCVAEF